MIASRILLIGVFCLLDGVVESYSSRLVPFASRWPLRRAASRRSRWNGRVDTRRYTVEDDPEDVLDEEFLYAPTTEKSLYVSEAEVAARANEMVATMPFRELRTEIESSFLQYALSIIMGRAIPDGRDGLKPVHRRILYAMDQLRLYATAGVGYRKCARVVGEVLGKYHPHGDTAVYDALVRLAQEFNTNHLLIDGHGNFGSIDADPAAAMRYTECRLSKFVTATVLRNDELHPTIVPFQPNFDGNEQEPQVLPARVPLLLLNGSSGIAVGMATNIPPHNLRELLQACTALVQGRMQQQTVADEQLLRLIPGPDFPTGATILGTAGARKLYTTSNGGIIMRAVTKMEAVGSSKKKRADSTTASSSTRTAIVVTELPYQVNKAALLERIAALVNEKKLEGISDLRDESSGRDGIRIVIELKRDANPAVVRNNLFQKTSLQTTFVSIRDLTVPEYPPSRLTLSLLVRKLVGSHEQRIGYPGRERHVSLGTPAVHLASILGLLPRLSVFHHSKKVAVRVVQGCIARSHCVGVVKGALKN
jgi:DNA gyrase/topoisomerase IV subunit A